MKVIDLLNKIANGDIDDLPDAIKYKGNVYGYDGLNHNYVRTINYTMDFLIGEDITAILNDEVEIIEKDKKIKHIENYVDFVNLNDSEKFDYLYEMEIRIIDYINKEKDNV